MDDKETDREKDCCARCRWTEVRARPYGAVDYVCARLGEEVASSLLAKRACSQFER